MTTRQTFILAAVLILASGTAGAETVRLKNGETFEGTLGKVEGDNFLFTLKDGKTKKAARSEISSLDFTPAAEGAAEKNFLNTIPAAPASKFQSPLQTFEEWRKAAIEGDIDRMAACYASFRQADIKKELKKMNKEQRERTRSATAQTEFIPAEPFYQGDHATLEVTWRIGLTSDSQVLQFTLEKNDWKIIQ